MTYINLELKIIPRMSTKAWINICEESMEQILYRAHPYFERKELGAIWDAKLIVKEVTAIVLNGMCYSKINNGKIVNKDNILRFIIDCAKELAPRAKVEKGYDGHVVFFMLLQMLTSFGIIRPQI